MTNAAPAVTIARELLLPRGALGGWWAQGLRSALLFKPDWTRLQATPAVLLVLLLAPFALAVLAERLYIDGEARFYGPSLMSGWLSTVVTLWACWLASASGSAPANEAPVGTAALFGMLTAQHLGFVVVSVLLFVPIARDPAFAATTTVRTLQWGLWLLLIAWMLLAQCRVIWRSGSSGRGAKATALLALLASAALHQGVHPTTHWYAAPREDAAAADDDFKLTQALMERQPHLLADQLQGLAARTPGEVNVYALTFAPYASEDVFKRESAMVSSVMQQRFGTTGKALQLVNHRDTAGSLPWATPLNLQRAIQRAGELMDKEDDVLFIHLTSHGARNGELAADFWPMMVEPLTPQHLKAWLDQAGIRNRVLSISACYSGSWIAPLADDHTLVMTAADATHTSYGCGRGSTLTYFGRAMFDEQLRQTWSFEAAHAAARTVIEAREKEAGKTDGFSNPQISMGQGVRPILEKLAAQQQAARVH